MVYIVESESTVNLSKPIRTRGEVLCVALMALFINKTEYNACIEPASLGMIFR